MAYAQEGSWEPVSSSLECPVWVDGWHHLEQLHLAVVKLKRSCHRVSTRYRSTASIKYEAQLVFCKDTYQVNMW